MAPAGDALIETVDQIAPVAVQPAFRLHEIEEQHPGERGEREGVALGPAAGRRQAVRQPFQRGPERPEEPRGDAFVRERFADPQAERERRFSCEGAEPLQRVERAAGRLLQGNGGEADRGASAAFPTRGRAPTRAHETPRARAERACEAALGLRGQTPCGRADRPLRVACLDCEDAERLVPRHQGRANHARPFCLGRTEPGSGWHGLPRRMKPERPKEVAKIVDLLGAGEKFPQHHGIPGSETTKVVRGEAGLGTAMLRRGPDYCRDARCGMRDGSVTKRIPHPASRVLTCSFSP